MGELGCGNEFRHARLSPMISPVYCLVHKTEGSLVLMAISKYLNLRITELESSPASPSGFRRFWEQAGVYFFRGEV